MKSHQHESKWRGSALDELLSRVDRRVRVLDGPLLGAAYKVWSGIRIGRQATCDILVLLPQISRQHAQLVQDMHGDHWLMDLESSNGTWIGAQRVGRQLLLPGTVFRVGDVRFIYEDEPQVTVADARGEVMAVSQHHAPGRRDTRELRFDGHRSMETVSGPAEDRQGAAGARVVAAVGADAKPYEGCLVDDLVEYRSLRLRMLQHGLGSTGLLDRLELLEDRLWEPREPEWEPPRHRPTSFECQLPAALRFADGTSVATSVRRLAVDGAEVAMSRLPVNVGEVVWLAFELVDATRPRSVVSTCRVISVDRDSMHLGFVGLSDEWECLPQEVEPTVAARVRPAPIRESSSTAAGMGG